MSGGTFEEKSALAICSEKERALICPLESPYP